MTIDTETTSKSRGRPGRLTDRKRLEAARLAEQQAAARRQALEHRVEKAERAADTRRKVILGGALIARASSDPVAAHMLADLIKRLDRQQDRTAFEGWNLPAPCFSDKAAIVDTDGVQSPAASPPMSSLFDADQWAREDRDHG